MFELLFVKPVFNLLVLIYALLPGHNFGLALIAFTIVVRLLMWPLVKKQLHHAKAMRELQPEIKKIKKAAKGNRQQESLLLMQLYKEREISPFSSIGILIVQLVILIGLYQGLVRVIDDPQAIITYSYSWLSNFGWLKDLAGNIDLFDATLFGFIDLTRAALGAGGIYWPAMFLVVGSAVTQFYQSKQLMPSDDKSRSLRQIMRDAGREGRQADQAEVQAATNQTMKYFIPFLIFIFTINLASALALYWFVSGLVAYIQQSRVLGQDKIELQTVADTTKADVIEGEVIERKPKKKKPSKASKKAKRRKK